MYMSKHLTLMPSQNWTAGAISSNRGGQFNPKRHSFGAPSGTSLPSVRIVLSEPFGADCIPGGVSPWGLDAGAPPDLVLSGPVFPCGCVTLPLGLEFVDGSLGFDWEKATDTADKAKAAVKAISPRDMATSEGHTSKSRDRYEFQRSGRGMAEIGDLSDVRFGS